MHVVRKRKPILRDCTIKGQTLSTVGTATYLEVELSSDLAWNKQVENVAAKVNRTLSFIRRTVTTSSFEAKAVAYKTLVRQQMEYSASITDPPPPPHTHLLINTLERVQCHGTEWVAGEYQRMASVTEIMAEFGW